MSIKKRSYVPRRFLCFAKKVILTSAMICALLFSNGGYLLLSTLQFETLADIVGASRAQAATVGDAFIIYDQTTPTTNVQERAYTVGNNTVGAATSPFAGTGASKHVRMRSSEMRDELILGIQDSAGVLTIYMKSSDGTWASQWSATVGDGNLGRFDIGYEKTSGDALVVYSGNTATNGQELKYYTWNGSTWTGPTNLGSNRTTGIVYGIKMEDRSTAGTNEIGLVYEDTNFDISANVWTGAGWYGEPAAALSVNGSKIGTNTAPTNRNYAITFESLSGDLMVIWGEDAVLDPKYIIKPAGGAWGSVVSPTMFTEEGTMMDIAVSPTSDRIAYVNCTDNGGDCDFSIWSGSAWGTAVNDATSGTPIIGDSGNNVEWLIDGANEVAVYSYNDAQTGRINWYTSTNGAQPVAQTDNNAAPVTAGAVRVGYAKPIAGSPNKALFAFGDANADLFLKEATLTGTTVAWSNPVGISTAIETNTSVTGFNSIAFAFLKFVPLVNDLTIGATAGTMAPTVNSGDVNQYANATACASAAACAAFTLNVSNTSVTVTSLTITETGTVADADLANIALFYDTDGNYTNGVTGQYGATVSGLTAGAAKVNGSLALTPGTTYYFYVRYDAINGTNAPSGGQTINFSIASSGDVTFTGTAIASGNPVLAGSTTVIPNATATTYGSGVIDGGRSNESITLSGYGFGIAPVGSRGNCAGAVNTGCVRFLVGGAATIATADVTAWSNTSITYTINPGFATFGGTNAVEVVAGGQADASDLTFIIYPNVTGMAVCATCGTNAAREYNVADTEGLAMVQGDHFGSTAGTATFGGGFGSLAGTIHATAEGPCTTGGWSASGYSGNTACVEVNSSIANSVYTGIVTVTRNSDAKTDFIDLRILPRIISNTPSSALAGATVQILGDHFCESGVCPTAGNRSTVSDHVLFGTTQAPDADFLALSGGAGACNGVGAAWIHTEICVKVPSSGASGSEPTKVTSNNLYTSNEKPFTVISSVPGDPINLSQYESDGTTPLTTGSSLLTANMYFKADISAALPINMALQIEEQTVGIGFTCGAGACVAATEGTVGGGGACLNCTSLNAAQVLKSNVDGSYHWQARTRNTTTNEFSSWVSYGGNLESDPDYIRDTSAPAITSGPSVVVDTNSATVTWGTSGEQSTTQVQYNTTGTFVNNCATNNDCTVLDVTYVFNHSVVIGNLDSNTTYYYRVRSKDALGNETIGSTLTFTTSGVTQPGKTTTFHIMGLAATVAGSETASSMFSVLVPETAPLVKNAFIEVTGISDTSGTNNVQLQMNGAGLRTFALNASSKTYFKIMYQINPSDLMLNDTPSANSFSITPSLTTYISSAKIVVTYAYTP